MRPRLFLDLDRTLFRTSEFDQAKWPLIAARYPQIDAAWERARQSDFYVTDATSGMYYYDFWAHVRALALPEGEVVKLLQESVLTDGRLEYEGVRELVAWAREATELAVLTYGPVEYQLLKANLCPSLRGVEIITTLQPKHYFFATLLAEHPGGEVWMVDDKAIGAELPAGARFIQAAGYNDLPVPEAAAWPVAHTVSSIPQLIS